MFSFFKKSKPTPAKQLPLTEALAVLERLEIRRRADVSMDDLLFSIGGTGNDPIDYVQLLCVLGSQVEREKFQPVSDDIWHFDTECIVSEGDYVAIAERLMQLSKGALAISNIKDHVATEESKAWLEFRFRDREIRWHFKVQDDWVDAAIFTKFVQLFSEVPSEARFTYTDLGGQDCLVGFFTEEQSKELTTLSGLKFERLR